MSEVQLSTTLGPTPESCIKSALASSSGLPLRSRSQEAPPNEINLEPKLSTRTIKQGEPDCGLLDVLGPVPKAQLPQSRLHPLLCELLDRRESKIVLPLKVGEIFTPHSAQILYHA